MKRAESVEGEGMMMSLLRVWCFVAGLLVAFYAVKYLLYMWDGWQLARRDAQRRRELRRTEIERNWRA